MESCNFVWNISVFIFLAFFLRVSGTIHFKWWPLKMAFTFNIASKKWGDRWSQSGSHYEFYHFGLKIRSSKVILYWCKKRGKKRKNPIFKTALSCQIFSKIIWYSWLDYLVVSNGIILHWIVSLVLRYEWKVIKLNWLSIAYLMQLQCTLSCNIICYYDFLSFMLMYFTFLLFLTVNKSFAKSLCYSSLISIIQDIDSIIYEPANCERKSWQLKVMVEDSFLVLKMYFD